MADYANAEHRHCSGRLITFVAAYIGFFILCFVAYASSANAEPVPALLVDTPVGAIAPGIVVIVRLALRNSR
jgi:hypothetical protein